MEAVRREAKFDVHAGVTREIIQAIEAGASRFEMPWHLKSGATLPRNALTGRGYRGINAVTLWSASRMRSLGTPYWATFRQWNMLGAKIRGGEKSTLIVFYKREASNDGDDAASEKRSSKTVLRYSAVFNAAQVDGWQGDAPPRPDQALRLEPVDAFVGAIGAVIRYGGLAAYYNPTFDRIHMPNREDFVPSSTRTETEGFYSVLLHEHIHWSGHRSRLDRNLENRFGDAAYAMEELTAELGAAFLCAELGISVHPRKDHAAYVVSWLAILRQQVTAIFKAASSASIATAYLIARGFLPKQ